MTHCSRLAPVLATVLLLVGMAAATCARSAPPPIPADFTVELPPDLSRVSFFLITVDVGNQVWDNFGHTALRMVDENSNTDTVFNWGLFDTRGGLLPFAVNFLRGEMIYQLGTAAPDRELALYTAQGRTVWQDRIQLNAREKAILYRRLMWNLQADNIRYPYQYFFDNCTTRVRDYLDEATGGAIQMATGEVTAHTFRDLVRYHYRSLEVVSMSLDILMNADIDRPVTGWEEMFLPSSLRTRLYQVPANTGGVEGRPMLLTDADTLVEFAPPMPQASAYPVAAGTLLTPVVLLFLFLRKVPVSYLSAPARISLGAPRFSYRLLGLLGVLTAVFSGVYGAVMLGGWFFSAHTDLYANWNLLLFWPTDLLGLVVAGRWLLFAKPWPVTHNSAPFVYNYLLAHCIAAALFVVAGLSGMTEQSILRPLMYLAPGLLLYTVLIWLVGFQQQRTRGLFR